MITNCNKCGLCKGIRHYVNATGNLKSEIMIVGEAPGYDEDKLGKPFVGASGEFLNEVFKYLGIDRRKLWITNVCKCRPHDNDRNRMPTQVEIDACIPYLFEEIEQMKPKVIVTLGNVASFALLGKTYRGITRDHGRTFELGTIKVVPVYHPSYCLRQGGVSNEQLFKLVTFDFIVAFGHIPDLRKYTHRDPSFDDVYNFV